MTDEELDLLVERISERLDNRNCPHGVTARGAQFANIGGRANDEVCADESDFVLLFRIGKESNGWIVKLIRYSILVLVIIVVLFFVAIGANHLPQLFRGMFR